MRRTATVLILASILAGAASVARAADVVPPNAVAVVAGQPVTRTAYDHELRRIRHSYRLKKRSFPRLGTPAHRRIRDSVIALLVWRIELRIAAARLGIVVPASEIERRIDQIRQQWGSNERQFRSLLLRRLGLSVAGLRADVRARLTLERVRERFRHEATATPAEISDYYATHLDEFRIPDSRDVRQLVVRTRAAAARLRAQLGRGATFARLAQRHSLDRATRRRGGLTTVVAGHVEPSLERVAFSLPRRAVSAPVRAKAGWYLVMPVSAIRSGRLLELREVESAISETLKHAKTDLRLAQWIAAVKAEFVPLTRYAPGFEPSGR